MFTQIVKRIKIKNILNHLRLTASINVESCSVLFLNKISVTYVSKFSPILLTAVVTAASAI